MNSENVDKILWCHEKRVKIYGTKWESLQICL